MRCNPHCLLVRMPTLAIFWYDIPLKSLTNLPFTSGNQAPRMNKTHQVRSSAFFQHLGPLFLETNPTFLVVSTPLKKMKVSWDDDYSQLNGKS